MKKTGTFRSAVKIGGVLSVFALAATSSHAATRTWDGSTSTDYHETTNWSGDDVPDSDDIGTMDGDGAGVTLLSGGITPGTVNAFNVRNGHVFNIDNAGGTFAVSGNLNVGRGAAGNGSTIHQFAGTVSLGGLDMGGNTTGGTSFYTLSGGSLSIGGFDHMDIGGEFATTFAIVGDSATITVTNNQQVIARDTSTFSFTLGATGTDAIDTAGIFTLESDATLIVDGSAYTGGAGTIPLFSYATRTSTTEFTTENISGFTGYDVDVVYDADSIDLVITTTAPQASSISVNFHVGDDATAQSDHELAVGESAGFVPVDGQFWNNINVGTGAAHNSAASVFSTTALIDDTGASNAATLSAAPDSTYFVGYASSTAANAQELGLSGNDDDLFNSYLGLNGPSGDKSPEDAAILAVTGLGAAYTSGGYSLIIYSDTDKGPSSGDRRSEFIITPTGGSPITVFTEDDSTAVGGSTFSGSFVLSDGVDDGADYSNYVVVEGLTAAGFTLEVTSPGAGGRGGISGFQIITGSGTPPTGPVIHSFAADDIYVIPGASVTLSWDVADATSLTLDPGAIDVTGTTSFVVNPTATTTYTLSASDGATTVQSTVDVTVGPARPNILVFLVDDMGITDTSVPFAYDSSGNPVTTTFNNFYVTPNMQVLANQGMKFTQAYATPVCSSTRASLMTGFNTTRHGVISQVNPNGVDPNRVSPNTNSHGPPNDWKRTGMQADDVTMPMLLGAAGYRTIHTGKGHFGSSGSYAASPLVIGFDVNFGGGHEGSPGSYTGNYGNLPNMDPWENTGTFLTDALTQAMNGAIEDAVDDGVPFFAYMSHYAVHSPFTNDPNATGDYSAAVSGSHQNFATMVEGMDLSLGAMLAKLDQLGVAEETLVIFLGDNGSDSPATNPDDLASGIFSDFPQRGKKGSAWEGGIHVPMIVAWAKPDTTNPLQSALPIPQGSREDDLVVVWDILPTVLSATNTLAPHVFDGFDLTPYFKGIPGTHRPQNMLMYLPIDHRNDFFSIYRDANWKLIYRFASDSYEVYDLDADPTESNDLAAANPNRVMKMARAMAREFDRTWGIQGKLWPTFTGTTRPSINDPLIMPTLGSVDIDMDGLSDNAEDSDLDGLVGAGETDPDNEDSDGDKLNDGNEIRTGTNPLNASSFFNLEVNSLSATQLMLTWPSAPGAHYQIEESTTLGNWGPLFSDLPASDPGSSTSQEVDIPESADAYFLRVLLQPEGVE